MTLQFIAPLPSGSVVGDYLVERLLGQGGFGSTYFAVDTNIHKPVAIKELTPIGLVRRQPNGFVQPNGEVFSAAFEAMKRSFLSEARLLAKFRHPNLATILRYFEANGTAFIVMTYEEGVTLRRWTQLGMGTISEDELEAILIPICHGLALLHSENLIHRDIKPDNIIVRPDGSPCLIDFGAAVSFARLSPSQHIDVVATMHYAPPEQFDPTGAQGPWTDVYALGATLFEVLTGHLPPTAQSRLANDHFAGAAMLARGRYSTRLLVLVDRCLALDPRERPSSIESLLLAFRPDDDRIISSILNNVSLKMATHFLNWAKPNDDLVVDELVAFVMLFAILDVSWRLGEGIPSRDTASHLLDLTLRPTSTLDLVMDHFIERGFTRFHRQPTLNSVIGRLDQYAASYLLDRQAEDWSYDLTRAQLIKQCLYSPTEVDREGFSSLMEDVIDRARGRVKKELGKQFDRVAWFLERDGRWTKRIRPSAASGFANQD